MFSSEAFRDPSSRSGIRGSSRKHVGVKRLVGCGYRHVGALGKPVELVVGAVDLAHEVVDAMAVLRPD